MKIFIPVAMPGIIAATIFAFTVGWGAFLYPLAYLYTSNQMVLTVGIISDLIRGDVFQWGTRALPRSATVARTAGRGRPMPTRRPAPEPRAPR